MISREEGSGTRGTFAQLAGFVQENTDKDQTVKNAKIASVVTKKTSVKKGVATVTVKGKKKGSTKLTVKIGKKSAKVTVKVK